MPLMRRSYRTTIDDIKHAFEKYGEVKDVYLPKDYHTGELRGFGFVEFIDERDALDAKEEMDRRQFDGREITVIFAQDRRKTPDEMRVREDDDGGGGVAHGVVPAVAGVAVVAVVADTAGSGVATTG